MPIIEATTGLKEARGEYSFAVNGGAVSTITLSGGDAIGNYVPAGAIVYGGWIEVDTVVTSAAGNTGTIAVGLESTNDLLAAAVVSGAPWSSTGRKAVVPVMTAATTVKTTASRSITITVAVAALTAGVFRVVLLYR